MVIHSLSLMHISRFIDTLGTKRCKRTENNDKRNTRRQKKNEKNFAMLFVKSMEFNGVQPQETQVQLKNWKTRWQVMLPKKSTAKQELKRNENEGWEGNKIRYRKAWRNFSFIEYTLQSAIGTQHPQLPSPHLCYGINEKADSLVFLPHFWVRSSIAKCSVDPVPWTPSPSKPKRRIDRKKMWNTENTYIIVHTWCSSPSSRNTFWTNWSHPLTNTWRKAMLKM